MPSSDADSLHLIEDSLRRWLRWMATQLGVPWEELEASLEPGLLSLAAETLQRDQLFSSPDLAVDFHLLDLPETPDGSFPFVLCIPRRWTVSAPERSHPEQKACFVGCRFDDLRPRFQELLERLLKHYGYELRFAELDPSQHILDVVLKLLNSSDVDLACFNTRGTGHKPNVYIEVGIAWTLGKEALILHDAAMDLPSNLGDDPPGLTVIPYSSHHQLAWELTTQLPSVLRRVSQARP